MTDQTTNRILKLGVVPAIALWLLYTFINTYTGKLEAIGVALDAHETARQTEAAAQRSQLRILIDISRAGCHIQAETQAEHASCEVGK